MSEAPCASRAADSAPSLVHGNSPRRHTLRSRSRLPGLERFPNHRVLRRRDGTEQNRHRFFAPKFGRNKKEQLRGPARRNFPSVGRDRPARRANANNEQLSRRQVPKIDDLLNQIISTSCFIRFRVQPPASSNAPISCRFLQVVSFIRGKAILRKNKRSASTISTFYVRRFLDNDISRNHGAVP